MRFFYSENGEEFVSNAFWQFEDYTNYTQNEVVWEFDFLQTNGFEDMPMEKWFNFSQTISE